MTPTIRPTGLRKRGILAMIVLTIASLGFYLPVWFLRRRAAFNALDSPRKLPAWPFLVWITNLVIVVVVAIAAGDGPPAAVVGQAGELVLELGNWAVVIVAVLQAFRVREILEDHLAGPEYAQSNSIASGAVTLSGLATFFLGAFYLQHAINAYVLPLSSQDAGA